MQQFIRYLYEYEGEKRIRNVGFVKVEKQDTACAIQIRAKDLATVKGQKIEVFVFYRKGDAYIQVSQGRIECENTTSQLILRFEADDMGGMEAFTKLHGILLHSESGHIYGAVWDDSVIPMSRVMTQEEWEEQQKESENIETEEASETEAEVQEKESETEAKMQEGFSETKMEKSEDVESEKTYVEEAENTEKNGRKYEKICRKDLVRLSRKEWRLANNSFLLHGFYNYHHLLYIEEGENCWIGVPGIFHEKEQDAARAFGFPQFHRITEGTLELSGQERNFTEDFGYWCRAVTKGQ